MMKHLKDLTQQIVNIYPELRKDVGIIMHNLIGKVKGRAEIHGRRGALIWREHFLFNACWTKINSRTHIYQLFIAVVWFTKI